MREILEDRLVEPRELTASGRPIENPTASARKFGLSAHRLVASLASILSEVRTECTGDGSGITRPRNSTPVVKQVSVKPPGNDLRCSVTTRISRETPR